nr:DEAD-like helicase [Amarillovirales sp.]
MAIPATAIQEHIAQPAPDHEELPSFRESLKRIDAMSHTTKIGAITAFSLLLLVRQEATIATAIWKCLVVLSILVANEAARGLKLPNVQIDYITLIIMFKHPWFVVVVPLLRQFTLHYRKYTTMILTSRHGAKAKIQHEHSLLDNPVIVSIWTTLTYLHINVLGVSLEVEFVTKPDLNREVIDKFTADQEIMDVQEHLSEVYNIHYFLFAAAVFVFCVAIGGIPAASIGSAVLVAVKSGNKITKPTKPDDVYRTFELPIGMKDGLYYVKAKCMGTESIRGTAWVEDGTLYTRYHVTNGNALMTSNGGIVYPSYINKVKDNISYGSAPKYANIFDGQEITVCLLGPHSNLPIMYRSEVKLTASGTLFFPGLKSAPGCSGSPVFIDSTRVITTESGSYTVSEKQFAGCIGWFFDHQPKEHEGSDRVGTELMGKEDGHSVEVPIINGSTTQYFAPPGSGKTRRIMPGLVRRGLNLYGKAYVTGPTKVVCQELYNALNEEFPNQVALCTSNATTFQRGSRARPIMIAAHATMLSMLVNGSEDLRKTGLWVIDEAHASNSKSMFLKDYIRHSVEKCNYGASVEMTATGWNFRSESMVVKEGSNYPIRDIHMDSASMIEDIKNKALEGEKKIIVFCTSIDGREPSSTQALTNKLRTFRVPPESVITLSRRTFNKMYPKAVDPTTKIILTTDISECGANFDGDIVYDFQESTKPKRYRECIVHEKTKIDEGQRVQRRGRIGRTHEGDYISPGYYLPESDTTRAEYFDRAIFAEALGIQILDPMPLEDAPHTVPKLTTAQLKSWVLTDENAIESPWMVDMLTYPDGRRRTGTELLNRVQSWARKSNVHIRVDEKEIAVEFWDSRDALRFSDLARHMGLISGENISDVRIRAKLNSLADTIYRGFSSMTMIDRLEEDERRADSDSILKVEDE